VNSDGSLALRRWHDRLSEAAGDTVQVVASHPRPTLSHPRAAREGSRPYASRGRRDAGYELPRTLLPFASANKVGKEV
jgi:hypothetical protein